MSKGIRQLPPEWVKLNLGCNVDALPGWVNVDVHHFAGVDVVTDLQQPWPWQDNSVHYIRAFDLVEHLSQPIHTMNEAYRVLKPGGVFEIWVPSTDGRGAFQDPTHVSFWNRNSFLYYSQSAHAKYYPNLIHCDFAYRLFDTEPNPIGVIWTWALCRAKKPVQQAPAVSDQWFDALSNGNPDKRSMEGFTGNGIGTVVGQ